jgi:hypothetical protein
MYQLKNSNWLSKKKSIEKWKEFGIDYTQYDFNSESVV